MLACTAEHGEVNIFHKSTLVPKRPHPYIGEKLSKVVIELEHPLKWCDPFIFRIKIVMEASRLPFVNNGQHNVAWYGLCNEHPNLTHYIFITMHLIKAPLYWLRGPIWMCYHFVNFNCHIRSDLQATCSCPKRVYLIKYVTAM